MAHLKESLTHLCKVLAPNCKACPRAGKSNIGASITQTCHFLGGSEAGICAAPLGSYPGSLPAARGSGVKRQDGPRESAGPGPEGTVQGRAQSSGSARHHIVHIFPLIPAVPPLPPALFRSHGLGPGSGSGLGTSVPAAQREDPALLPGHQHATTALLYSAAHRVLNPAGAVSLRLPRSGANAALPPQAVGV